MFDHALDEINHPDEDTRRALGTLLETMEAAAPGIREVILWVLQPKFFNDDVNLYLPKGEDQLPQAHIGSIDGPGNTAKLDLRYRTPAGNDESMTLAVYAGNPKDPDPYPSAGDGMSVTFDERDEQTQTTVATKVGGRIYFSPDEIYRSSDLRSALERHLKYRLEALAKNLSAVRAEVEQVTT